MLRGWSVVGVVALCVLSMAQTGKAQTWDGGSLSTNNWTDPANWNPDGVPPTNGLGQVSFGGTTRLNPFVDMPWNIFTINFNGGAGPFVIGGNFLGNINSISNFDNDTQTINNNIGVGFSSSINAASGPLLFGGNITTDFNNTTITGGFNTQFNGILSGPGTLFKTGAGFLTLAGGLPNTFNGTMNVNGGTLVLGKVAGNAGNNFGSALGGPLVINSGGTVMLLGSHQINDGQPMTISGLLDLNGFQEGTAATVTMNGGTITTGSGTFTLGANLVIAANASPSTIIGNLSLNGGTRTIAINDGAAPNDLEITANVSNGTIIKQGAGTLRMAGANTYAGGTTLNSGPLLVHAPFALGSGPLTINGGTIGTAPLFVAVSTPLILNGDFSTNGGAFMGGATLTGTRTVDVPSVNFTLSGAIVESAAGSGITKTGSGNLLFNGITSNTYTGTTTVNAGTLFLSKSFPDHAVAIPGPLVIGDGVGSDLVTLTDHDQIADSSQVTINTSGELRLIDIRDTIGGLTMNGGSVTGQSGFETLAVNGNITTPASATATATISAKLNAVNTIFQINDGPAAIDMDVTGNILDHLDKRGTGTLRLSGTQPVTLVFGGFVTQGTLILNKTGAELNGGISVGSSGGLPNSAILRLDAANQITDSSPIRVGSAGLFNLNGFNETVGHVQMQGGTITTGTGTLTLAAGLEAQSLGSSIQGNLSLGGTEQTFQIFNDPSLAPEIDISAVISNGSLRKTDLGTLRFSGGAANTYTGLTTVDQGTLLLGKAAGVNAITGDLVIGNNVNSPSTSIVQWAGSDQINDNSSITMNRSGMLFLGVFTETVRNFTMNDGFMSFGTITTTGTFTYNAGIFSGRLSSRGAVVFNADFNPQDGMDNYASMTVNAGRTVSFDGGGFYNDGLTTLAGGTLAGSGNINNVGTIQGAGAIDGGGQFFNFAQLTISGGNLDIGKTGISVNSGNIDVPAGSQLRLFDGGLQNLGTINLAGGSITGSAALVNSAGGTIAGRGLLATLNVNSGTILAQGGTVNLLSALGNPGTIRLMSGAGLAGGTITNTGVIQGDGSISNSVNNTGTIEGIGTLVVGGTLTNTGTGLITAGPGSKVLVSAGLATNSGVINLTGGTFHNNGFALSNTGQISGFGTFFTGGLTNNGAITFTGGFTTINGNVTNAAGRQLRVAHDPALFTGNVINNGIFKNTGTTITFAGTYTENGTFISDPADNFFSSVSIGENGAWVGGVGDRFFISGDLLSSSTNKMGWQTSEAELRFTGGLHHLLAALGEDRGISFDGYDNNFAWGNLTLDPSDHLTLTATGALYVHELHVSDIAQITSSQNIYYDLRYPANAYLGGQTYALAGGGQLTPVPEPGFTFLGGVMALVLGRRRRNHAH